MAQQYAFRAQKSTGLVGGSPDYVPAPPFDSPARTFAYSPDGRLYAYALAAEVHIVSAESASLVHTLPIPNVHELSFSPRGTYLSTWERPTAEGGNLRVFSTSTATQLASFSQKSMEAIQYTISESHAIRLVAGEVHIYKPSEWQSGSDGSAGTLQLDDKATTISLSPGLNPSIAVFVAENPKKSSPASIKIYTLTTRTLTSQKTFFKADRATLKWNALGTQVLLLTHTEVDNSNKSYYGETGMYLLSAAGNFDCRVTLDKEGPIHDFAWSPNSKEFGVVYGYMPAKTMLFDQRVRPLHTFGPAPQNFISFNPQGRLVALAGFGNLAGKLNIYDRRTLALVTTIDAPNTSHCEWSPDGRFLMTATLSPRLRVDNGIKIWHCTGPLMHVQVIEELYQVGWRPIPLDSVPPLTANGAAPAALPVAPQPHASVLSLTPAQSPSGGTKPAGAYRPPGARGLATPSIFKREDEGGVPNGNGSGSGSNTPTRGYRPSAPPGSIAYVNGNGNGSGHGSPNGGGDRNGGGRRHVPGAHHNNNNGNGGGNGNGNGTGDDKKNARKRNKGAKRDTENPTPTTPTPPIAVPIPIPASAPLTVDIIAAEIGAVDASAPDSALDPVAKKARNLNKKLKAIDELKEKAKRGERLEATQLKKMEGEGEIRRELALLGQ